MNVCTVVMFVIGVFLVVFFYESIVCVDVTWLMVGLVKWVGSITTMC